MVVMATTSVTVTVTVTVAPYLLSSGLFSLSSWRRRRRMRTRMFTGSGRQLLLLKSNHHNPFHHHLHLQLTQQKPQPFHLPALALLGGGGGGGGVGEAEGGGTTTSHHHLLPLNNHLLPFPLNFIKELIWGFISLFNFLVQQPSQLNYIDWPAFQTTLKTATLTLVLVALLIVALSSVDVVLCYLLALLLRRTP